MGSQAPFRPAGRVRTNHVAKRLLGGYSAEAACAPPAKIILHASFKRFSKYKPRFPHRPGHHADFGELYMGVLRPVTATHGHYQTGNLTPAFKANTRHSAGNNI